MAVVKADGYGHGMVQVARAAREAGADWLGVATLDEALALRAAGDTGRLLCWLTVPGERLRRRDRGRRRRHRLLGRRARRDRRRGRGRGARPGAAQGRHRPVAAAARRVDDWPALVAAAPRPASATAGSRVTGVWSHFACADEPDHPANDAQEQVFDEALALAEHAGLRARGAPPGQLRRRDPAPERALRPGPRRASRRTGSTRRPARTPRPRPGPGDDPPRAAWPWSSASRPAPASPTATP